MNAPFRHEVAAGWDARTRAPRAILLLAHAQQAPYRVLRCAAAAGAKVYVFGAAQARGLAVSRYCAGFRDFTFDPAPNDEIAVARIEAFAQAHAIDMILPADGVTTRFLATIRARLTTPVFPIPDLATFDALATKDRFMDFCRARDIRHPQGCLLANREALMAALANDCVRLPAILKPINRWGGVGVVKIDRSNARAVAATIDYAPILIQDYVEGQDRSISILAREGRIAKQVSYCYPDGAFTFAREPELARIVAGIAREMRVDGVFNFDARIEADGTVWLLECNPRFFFTMDAAMIAGANFAKIEGAGDAVIDVPDCELRQPEALLKHLARGRSPNRYDCKMLIHWLKDPVYFGHAIARRHRAE